MRPDMALSASRTVCLGRARSDRALWRAKAARQPARQLLMLFSSMLVRVITTQGLPAPTRRSRSDSVSEDVNLQGLYRLGHEIVDASRQGQTSLSKRALQKSVGAPPEACALVQDWRFNLPQKS